MVMNSIDFVKQTIQIFNEDNFNSFKKKMSGKYIMFHILEEDEITRNVFLEKVIEYIEKVEIQSDKLFDKHLKTYINDIGSLVKNNLINDSRAKQYYECFCKKVNIEDMGIQELGDYSRVILCLYSKIIKENHNDITNFDLSFDNVDLNAILSAMKEERVPEVDLGVFNLGRKSKFNTDNVYGEDAFTFFLIIVFYYYLKNVQVKGDE